MHSDIENVYYTQIKDLKNVTGVPIKFHLLPISRLIDNFKIQKLYIKLEDTVIQKYNNEHVFLYYLNFYPNSFIDMLVNIHDYNYINCVRNRIIDENPDNGKIIFNQKSQISINIRNYEKSLIQITKKYFELFVKSYKLYKNGKKTNGDLLEIYDNFEKEFKITEIKNKIREFSNYCAYQLKAIQFLVLDKYINNYKLFTDELSLNEWYVSHDKPKILLKTAGNDTFSSIILFIFL